MTLLYLSLGYMVGIALGQLAWQAGLLGCATPGWLWLLPVAGLPCTPWLNRLRPTPGAPLRWPVSAGFVVPGPVLSPALGGGLLLLALTGALRYAAQPLTPCWSPADLAYYNLPADRAFDPAAPRVTVTGYISDFPLVENQRQRLQVTVETLGRGGQMQPVSGILRLSTTIEQRYRYGQGVRIQGRLVTAPVFDTFSYRAYLARQGVHSLLYAPRIELLGGPERGSEIERLLYGWRGRGEALLNRHLPEPHAGLANGILLGIEAGIPDDLYDQFNLTGTSHVIVISGSNVAIVVAVMMAFCQRLLGPRRAIYPTLLGVGAYALLVGGDAAVLRAALMGGLVVVATALSRRNSALVSLAAACAAMTLLNPLMVWDVGFQLSSMATASLILFTPSLTARLARLWPGLRSGILTASLAPEPGRLAAQIWHGLVSDALIVTLAANILVLPLIVYYFGRLSLISLFTNVAIAPAQPVILLWGSGGLLLGLAGLPLLPQLVLWVAWLGLYWTVAAVEWSARLPGASLEIQQFSSFALGLTYAAILFGRRPDLLTQLPRWLQRQGTARLLQPATLALLVVATWLVWTAALTQPDGRLHLYFLDIGQGDGILVQTPSGRQLLIDGGSEPQLLFSQLGAAMPYWDRSLDLVALTHPDSDHMDAQREVPRRFAVGQGLETSASHTNADADPWRQAMAEQGITVDRQHAGGWIDLGDGVALWVLWPPAPSTATPSDKNEQSLVLKLVYGHFSVLLTGDTGLPSEARWLADGLPLAATVLKLGHHGSAHSTGPELVAAVNPLVAVIQVGAENRYGHPAATVLANLQGRRLLRNDQHGAIHIFSDGRQMWIELEQGG